jgi:DNA-binding CsgD family transcriptional regulator
MDRLSDIIKKRSSPGVLIFDLHDRLLYSNQEALEMLSLADDKNRDQASVPEEIYHLCRKLREGSEPDSVHGGARYHAVLPGGDGLPCSVRGMMLGDHGKGSQPTHLMVLIERIVEKHQVDIDKARREFLLSKREAEVLRLICQGLANREIGETLFISEYTVKDHLKKIMQKTATGSRNEVVALLK